MQQVLEGKRTGPKANEMILKTFRCSGLSEVIKMQVIERETMTAQEVAVYLGCNRDTVYRLSNYGDLPCARVGSKKIFKKDQIDAWIDKQTKKEGKTLNEKR